MAVSTVVALSLGVAAVLGGTRNRERGLDARVPEAATARETTLAAQESARRAPTSEGESARATHPASGPAPTPGELRTAREGLQPASLVRGRVWTAEGAPLEGAHVRLEGLMAPIEIATSGRDGRFEGAWRPGGHAFVVRAEGRVPERRSVPFGAGGSAVDLGDVTLARGAVVEGTLVDGAGRPLAGAGIVTREAGSDVGRAWSRWDPALAAGRTDVAGRFRLDDCAEGEFVVLAWAGQGVAQSEALDLRVDRPVRVPLVLLDDPFVTTTRGTVVSDGGEPVEGLQVWAESFDTRTDASGAFALTLASLEPVTLRVEDPLERYAPLERPGVVPGAEGLELVVTPAAWIEMDLVDRQGAPIGWGHLTVQGPKRFGSRIDLDASGRVRVLRPERAFTVAASAPGFRAATLGPFDPQALDGPLAIVLDAGSFLRGRVRYEGRPVAGATLDLARAREIDCMESFRPGPRDWPFVLTRDGGPGQSDGTTDAEGRFVVEIQDAGPQSLRVSAEGLGHASFGPWNLGEGSVLDDLELEFPAPGVIEGRVRLLAGAKPGGFVGASNGNGLARTAPVDAEGRYRLDQLTPGEYQVRPCLPPVSAWEPVRAAAPCRGPIEWDCRVRSGQTTRFDLSLLDQERCVLLGRLTIDGRGPTEGEASLWQAEIPRAIVSLVGADFRLAVREPGRYRLHLQVDGISLGSEVDLGDGESRWDQDLTCGQVRFVGPFPPKALVELRSDPPGPVNVAMTLVPGDEPVTVPLGKYLVERMRLGTGRSKETPTVEVHAGVEVVVPWAE